MAWIDPCCRACARLLLIAIAGTSVTGCGLVFQGTTQRLSLQTTPAGVRASFDGQEITTPGDLVVGRRKTWRVLRASATGYRPACAIIACDMNARLVSFDSVPAAIPLLLDLAAGSLRRCPSPLRLSLVPLSEGESAEPLPPDAEILATWTRQRRSLCRPAPPTLQPQIWRASYDVQLVRVDRPAQTGIRYGAVRSVGGANKPPFTYADDNFTIQVLPTANGVEFKLDNLTPHTMKVVWDEVVFVDFDGTSNRVLHEGVRYVERNESHPPSVVAPHRLLKEVIVPVNRVISAGSSWQHLPIVPAAVRKCDEGEDAFTARAQGLQGATFSVLLPVEIRGVVNEYTLNFSVQDVKFVSEIGCPSPSLLSGDQQIKWGNW